MTSKFTNSFLTQIRSDVKDDIEALFLYGAVGIDDTAPSATQTALVSEVFRSDVDNFDKSTFTDKVIASLRISESEANGNTLKEGGWFDDPSAGTMHQRYTYNDFNKTNDSRFYTDSQITIEVTED